MYKKLIGFSVLLLALLCLSVFLFEQHHADQKKLEQILTATDQDPSDYVQKDLQMDADRQTQLSAHFLEQYFSPWVAMPQTPEFLSGALEQVSEDLHHARQYPGWGVNAQPLAKGFIEKLAQNADLATFPNLKQPGIMVATVAVRGMPTSLPSYGRPGQAGQGYPFDNWQISLISLGYPVYILHQSKDGLWYLIASSSYQGWVPAQSVAFAKEEFQQAWRSHPFVVSIKDDVPLYNPETKAALASMQMGSLYPKLAENDQRIQLMLPQKDAKGDAVAADAWADKNVVQEFPLPISTKAIAQSLEAFMNTPYGWGGLNNQRDCSATVQDVFALFGIWLPRNSFQQTRNSGYVSMTDLTEAEKLTLIHRSAQPFFSLIHFPGHVGIYIGQRQGQDYLLHDSWGIVTRNIWGKEGRIVIGRTVITPLPYPQGFYNVPKNLLQKATGFSNLIPPNEGMSHAP